MSEEQLNSDTESNEKEVKETHQIVAKTTDITSQIQEIDIRSSEVQEIMGYIPHWIIRRGITVIFSVVLLTFIGSWFFKYPDIIMSTFTLTTKNPPAVLVARSSGKIVELFVQDKQKVTSGTPIALLENSANYHNMFELKNKLQSLNTFFTQFNTRPTAIFNKYYLLGQLQSSYAGFLGSYDEYVQYFQLDLYQKKIAATRLQIQRYKIMHEQLINQNNTMQEDLKISKQNFERVESLYKENILSKNDYDREKQAYLQKQYSVQSAQNNIENSNIRINELEQSIIELEINATDTRKKLEGALRQAYDGLIGQIAEWEQTYLLKAPISGEVTFTKYWSINQNVAAGDKVLTIIPEKGGDIVGKVILPALGSGKVKVDQKVNIKFNNYPFMDFGIVSGVITSKSLIANDNNYLLEVKLNNGLVTSYGKTLDFAQEMQGVAEIITEDVRLIDRIFKPIKNLLTKMK